MTTEDHEDYTLKFDDSPEAKERVYQIMLKWFKKVEAFNGESLGQNDTVYIEAPELLTEVAVNGFKFEASWKEEF